MRTKTRRRVLGLFVAAWNISIVSFLLTRHDLGGWVAFYLGGLALALYAAVGIWLGKQEEWDRRLSIFGHVLVGMFFLLLLLNWLGFLVPGG